MIGAVVLAAGASSRMGRDKSGLTLPDGRSFLDAIRETLSVLRIDAVRVVVGPGDARTGDGVVVNPDPARGMLSSVQCGLSALPEGTDSVLVWPVDHPRVDLGTVATLIAACRAHAAPVVVPRYSGKRGHPVLFSGAAIEELKALPLTATAADVVHAHDDLLEIEVGDAGIVDDIDDPEAYEKAFGAKP
ncbi:MAG TPA: nucleotidyltransferase family protein [Candidatus Polarisedimenticolaceae bacterium]|nr:nucleotidyltransferase family protein [Candidatus Polarisedimenticolaceae bacterium]